MSLCMKKLQAGHSSTQLCMEPKNFKIMSRWQHFLRFIVLLSHAFCGRQLRIKTFNLLVNIIQQKTYNYINDVAIEGPVSDRGMSLTKLWIHWLMNTIMKPYILMGFKTVCKSINLSCKYCMVTFYLTS